MSVYLETPRLVLREFTEAAAEALAELDGDPEVMRFILPHRVADPGAYRLRDVEAYREQIRTRDFASYARGKGLGFWSACEKPVGAFIGWFHLRPALDYKFAAEAGYRADDLDLGYRLRRAAWGKGYATEGARPLVCKAFTGLGAERVVATALATNRASIRVMEKAGLTRERDAALPGFEEPALVYALTRERFEQGAGVRGG
jgi:RimJ/RimL family protein N-acetyltransferase